MFKGWVTLSEGSPFVTTHGGRCEPQVEGSSHMRPRATDGGGVTSLPRLSCLCPPSDRVLGGEQETAFQRWPAMQKCGISVLKHP